MKESSLNIRKDVTNEQLVQVIQWFLWDLREEIAEARLMMDNNCEDLYYWNKWVFYKLVEDMLMSRLSIIMEESDSNAIQTEVNRDEGRAPVPCS